MDLIPDQAAQSDKQVDAQMVDMRDAHFWHIDHGYGVTSRRGQGLDSETTFWAVPSSHPHLTTQKDATISPTRGTHHLTVFTDNSNQLVQTLMQQTGEKTTAIEVSGRTARVKDYIAKQQETIATLAPNKPAHQPSGLTQPPKLAPQRSHHWRTHGSDRRHW